MNTYGQTSCPKCGENNHMYRPLETIRELPIWDEVKCWQCGHEYKHTEQSVDLWDEICNAMIKESKLDQHLSQG